MHKQNNLFKKLHQHKKYVHQHIKKHHKKYLLGAVGTATLIKIGAIILTGLGIINYGLQHNSFANIEEIHFDHITNAKLNTEYFSTTGTLNGIETGIQLSIDNGRFRINTGEWNNQTGILYSGDVFQLKATSSSQYNTTNITTRHLNEFTTEFQITTQIELDEEPDSLYFYPITGAELDTGYISDMAIVSDINTGIKISSIGCQYKINSGNRTNDSGTIYSGDLFYVKIQSANSYNATIQGIVTIGTLSTYFSVTTKEETKPDKTIELIYFTDITGAQLDQIYYSSTKTITGINTGIIVQNDTGISFRINTGEWTDTSGRIYNQDLLQIYMKSSSGYSLQKTGILTIGTGQYFFNITTKTETITNTGTDYTGDINIETGIIFTGTRSTGEITNTTGTENTGSSIIEENTGTIISSGDYETGNMLNTGIENQILSGELEFYDTGSLLKLFKTELNKYQECKKNLNIKSVEIFMQKGKHKMNVPKFKSNFLANISAVFSNIILDAINKQQLEEEEIDDIISDFNNFLVVLKLLRDDGPECKQNLSNYYINKFQDSLEKYKIFGEK